MSSLILPSFGTSNTAKLYFRPNVTVKIKFYAGFVALNELGPQNKSTLGPWYCQVVSVLTFLCNDQSLNPAEVYNFYVIFKKSESKQIEVGVNQSLIVLTPFPQITHQFVLVAIYRGILSFEAFRDQYSKTAAKPMT